MTKSKTSTIAIVVLSVLLAAALAATIVLAAFTATGRASTTITFGGNLTMTLSATSDDYTIAGGTGSTELTITPKSNNFTGAVTIPTVNATTNMDSWVAFTYTATIKDRNGQTATNDLITVTPVTTFTEEEGAYVAQVTANTASPVVGFTITAADNNYDAVAGYSVTINMNFGAADSESDDGKASAIAQAKAA